MSFEMKLSKNNRVKVQRTEPNEIGGEYECVGGKINNNTLKHLIKNGYSDDPKSVHNIDGYVLDKSLSGQRAQVYHNPTTNHLVVNHRGTKGMHDVMTDIKLMFGHKNNNRFKHGKKVTDAALKKYDTDNVTIAGHSLAGEIVRHNNNNKDHDIIMVNPAVAPMDMFKKQKDNETVVRSKLNPISYLHNFNPFANRAKTIDISAKSLNPLTEHSGDILERLGDVDVGV